MDTINTILVKSVKICTLLQQDSIVIVCDQAIYSKAQQIRWKDDHLMARTVIRMGKFHTSMNFLASLGKRFRYVGLQDIIIESGLVAEGSANGVLCGRQYNRSIRMHKIVSEAMEHLRWQAFIKFHDGDEEQEEASNTVEKLQATFPSLLHKQLVNDEEFGSLQARYEKFVVEKSSSPTFAFWSFYIDMVEHLLLFIRATKEGNWLLHLSPVRGLLPWFFAYDHINYSRYLPAYWMEMKQLPDTHPSVHNAFLERQFAVVRQDRHGFAGIPGDQTIEQTINRDTKTKGGVIGFSNSGGSYHILVLSHQEE